MRSFVKIFIGQLTSKLGMTLSAFILSLWVLQQHHSILEYSFFVFLIAFPGAMISPLAGEVVDYFGSRAVLLACDSVSILVSILLYLLWVNDSLTISAIYGFILVVSVTGSFQAIAYVLMSSTLVPKNKYSTANGLIQISQESGYFLMPLVAGVFYNKVSIGSFFVVDIVTSIIALATLLAVKVAHPVENRKINFKKNLKKVGFKLGWQFHKHNPWLMKLFFIILFMNLIEGVFLLLLTPRAMLVFDPITLGLVMLSAGVGIIFGGLFMHINRFTNYLKIIYVGSIIMSLVMILMGSNTSKYACCVLAFLFCFFTPLVFGYTRVLYQQNISQDVQGKILGFKNFFDRFAAASSYLIVPIISGALTNDFIVRLAAFSDFSSYSITSLSRSLIFMGTISLIFLTLVVIKELTPRLSNYTPFKE